MRLIERLDSLTRSAAGYRARQSFEWTTETPREEQMGVGRPDKWVERILAELEFSIKLSESRSGAFDGAIDRAIRILEDAYKCEGALTRTACVRAEEAVLPLAEAAKEYDVILCSHAHIDMNWLWGMQETVAVTLATFRTILNLMDQYPEYTFSQSQASVYKIVEEYDPVLMKRIRARIDEGRWEITATAWVETDKNMPDAESLIRHVTETRAYLENTWGVNPDSLKIDFSPDTFGHSRFIPAIDAFADVQYYYHCRGRGDERDILNIWRAPDGSEIIKYCEPYWYNSGITPDVGLGAIEAARRSGGLKTSMYVYGAGDHGGGPTRRDVERAYALKEWPVFPRVHFGTFREYFQRAESVRGQLNVLEGELNFIFDGCYTTQSRIKKGNRQGERALLNAEALNALVPGDKYPEALLSGAWRDLLFTQFHDILPGSCVRDSREYAMGLFARVMATAESARTIAMERMNALVDTSMFTLDADISDTRAEGAGAGYGLTVGAGVPNPERGAGKTRIYTVYNPSPVARTDAALVSVWDWFFDLARVRWTDDQGRALECQLLDDKPVNYWQHHYVRMLVRVQIPPMGYASIALTEDAPVLPSARMLDDARRDAPRNNPIVLENARLRAVFEPYGATLTSLFDKCAGVERIKQGARGAFAFVECERASNDAWHIGRQISVTPVTDARSLTLYKGDVQSGFACEYTIQNSSLRVNVSLNADDDHLVYQLDADWREYAKQGENVPGLVFRVPLADTPEYYRMDVPAGTADRAPLNMDMPALNYAAAVYADRALALGSDSKYGYRCAEDALSVTLINAAAAPDPYPEFGKHEVKLMLGVNREDAHTLHDMAHAFLNPFAAIPNGSHTGCFGPKGSLLALEGECVLSAVGRAGEGIFTRVYEPNGVCARVRVKAARPVKSAKLVNAMGAQAAGEVRIEGGEAVFSLAPYAIAQVEMSF